MHGSNDEPESFEVGDLLPDDFRVFYEPKSKTYWLPARGGDYTNISRRDVPYHLMYCFYQRQDDVDKRIVQVQLQHSLAYVGSLPSWKKGPAKVNGEWLLITNSFKLIRPVEGDWSFIRRILEKRLGKDVIHFYVWLKLSYESLRDGNLEPRLYLALVGPTEMYKTFTQELIITPILGGRPAADPYDYFTGKTHFNAELAKTEHLMINDEEPHDDSERFNSKVKQYCDEVHHQIHPKGRDKVTVKVRWFLTQSANDTWPKILALPDFGDSAIDARTLLLNFEGPSLADWVPDDHKKAKARVDAALPGFIHFLVNMPIPAELRAKRLGQIPYKNKVALEKYFQARKEASLLELIDELRPWEGFSWKTEDQVWQGFTSDLERLFTSESTRPEIKERTKRIGAIGPQLGRMLSNLAENPTTSHRVRRQKRGGKSYYYIYPPTSA